MEDSAMVQIIKSAVLDVHNLNNIFVGSEKIIFTFCFHFSEKTHKIGPYGPNKGCWRAKGYGRRITDWRFDGLRIDGLTDYVNPSLLRSIR